MDETLVKVSKLEKDIPRYDREVNFQVEPPNKQSFIVSAFIKFRPYMHKMLQKLSQHFELILYTSGELAYGHAACNAIEGRQKYFSYRLTKDDCLLIED